MIKFKNLGQLGVLAVLVAFGATASAQTAASFTQSSNSTEDDPSTTTTDETVSSAPTVASELFGPGTGVKLEFGEDGFTPIYKLTYMAPMDTDGNQTDTGRVIGSDDVGTITYTLGGATFAERVSPNDFTLSECTIEIDSGGSKGDSSVTIEVTPDSDGWNNNTTVLTFKVPDLTATGRSDKAPVRMSASFSISKTSDFPEGGPGNKACGEKNTDGTQASARGCKVVNADKKINMFSLGGAAMGKIDLANRSKLISGTKNIDEIAIGTVTVGVADKAGTEIMGQDGKPASLTGDLAGDVTISVASSQFRDGDIVYIDDNGSKSQDDSRELFDISGGVATADRAIKAGSWTVIYVPNGDDALTHGTEMKVSAATDFTDRENLNMDAKMGASKSITTMLDLAGIRPNPAMAYAIAPLDNADTSNVRITCESGKACNAFLSCHDQAGNDYFGDAGIEIAANATAALDQTGVNAALGIADGESWSGRLACDVLSTAPVSVQVLTRSADVLVNNTYVEGGGK